jgi:phosphatidylcholine synthase
MAWTLSSGPTDRRAKGEQTVTPADARAFVVHIFTACGAALALTALVAAVNGRWALMFVLLGMALIVDGVDGTMARRFEVRKVLPRWDGDVLDLVVDFVTYVFVPAYAITAGSLLPPPLALPAGIAIVMTSAIYFADRRMKTADNYFRGFPALWNAAAFYLFLLKLPTWANALAVAILVVLTFVPFRFVHPVRVRRLRSVSIAALAAWSGLALIAVLRDLDPGAWVRNALFVIGIYFLAVGLTDRWGMQPPASTDPSA